MALAMLFSYYINFVFYLDPEWREKRSYTYTIPQLLFLKKDGMVRLSRRSPWSAKHHIFLVLDLDPLRA